MNNVIGYAFVYNFSSSDKPWNVVGGYTKDLTNDNLVHLVKEGNTEFRELYQSDIKRLGNRDEFTKAHENKILARNRITMKIIETVEIIKQ